MKKINILLPGLLFALLWALAAFVLSNYLPIGSVVIGITIGMFIGNFFKIPEKLMSGIDFSEKQILAWAIVLMGVKLDFNIVQELGIKSILMIVVSIIFTIAVSQIVSRIFGLNSRLGLLLGIGNGICGSSAIAATEKIIGAKKDEVGLSVTIINFLGTMGMFLLPILIKFILHFDDLQSGFFIGNTLQAVGQVVAAGFSINHAVGHTATIVKMMRILMLTPVVFSLIFYFHQKNKKAEVVVKKQGVPYFIIGFILFSLVPTFHLIPEDGIQALAKLSHYLLLVAMVAIGLKINFTAVLKQGGKALLVGSLIFLLQLIFTVMMTDWVL